MLDRAVPPYEHQGLLHLSTSHLLEYTLCCWGRLNVIFYATESCDTWRQDDTFKILDRLFVVYHHLQRLHCSLPYTQDAQERETKCFIGWYLAPIHSKNDRLIVG
eukprot:5628512-Pleurochrysis_carterae.AAC.10